MIDKIPYNIFINNFPSIENQNEETIKLWESRHKNSSFIDHMNDIWNEAKQCVDLKVKNDIKTLYNHIEIFMDIVNCVLTNPKLSNGAKKELREAEWELLDFCIWDNEWENTETSVMKWFNQWVYDYNYELY